MDSISEQRFYDGVVFFLLGEKPLARKWLRGDLFQDNIMTKKQNGQPSSLLLLALIGSNQIFGYACSRKLQLDSS